LGIRKVRSGSLTPDAAVLPNISKRIVPACGELQNDEGADRIRSVLSLPVSGECSGHVFCLRFFYFFFY
jgi:hypothetical protein